VAADILRGTLVRLDTIPRYMGAVAHTHDEVVLEPYEADENTIRDLLHDVMCRGFPWSDGLPIASGESSGYYYSKAED
jgi:hypothetical protein